MSILSSKPVLALLVFAAGFILLQPVMALDGKVYPGIMCQKSLGVGSYAGGEVRNDSQTGSLTVECPVVRDVVNGNISSSNMRVYKATSPAFWCNLYSKSYYGTAQQVQFRSASGVGYRTISFNPMADFNNAHIYYWCALSPAAGSSHSQKSRIIGYRLDEL
jgi:hypothetical protein